ncbi:MAG TPA: cyclic nucleotide-binding domain-containing protein [Anaerolineales bacterium]|nr:cyclic nucleotide-binding domain-containing protein [Anaerolineales bacterium]
MDDLHTLLRQAELFEGLSDDELMAIGALCQARSYAAGEIVTTQGERGDELYVISQGFVEIAQTHPGSDAAPRSVVHLGPGQIVGEMALVDRGPRSATVRALTDGTLLQALPREAFLDLCQANTHLGYVVMRNMAADLSFKLRHRMLAGR